MTVRISKSNSYAISTDNVMRISKSNVYLVLLQTEKYVQVGRVFPFSMGNTIWGIPFYFTPVGA